MTLRTLGNSSTPSYLWNTKPDHFVSAQLKQFELVLCTVFYENKAHILPSLRCQMWEGPYTQTTYAFSKLWELKSEKGLMNFTGLSALLWSTVHRNSRWIYCCSLFHHAKCFMCIMMLRDASTCIAMFKQALVTFHVNSRVQYTLLLKCNVWSN